MFNRISLAFFSFYRISFNQIVNAHEWMVVMKWGILHTYYTQKVIRQFDYTILPVQLKLQCLLRRVKWENKWKIKIL